MPSWFRIDPGSPFYCVVGSPIAHSRSPDIHRAFARETGVSLRYERVEVAAGAFADALAEFVVAGGAGMNVTVPLKAEACAAADERSEDAAACGAANTITIAADGRVRAANTDGTGLVRDLTRNHRVAITARRILILGAGGAASGVVPRLLDERPAGITIVNRTRARAEALIARFDAGDVLTCCDYAERPVAPFDVVVNATSSSLEGERPPLHANAIGPDTCCYDMVYTATGRTPFLDWASGLGAAACYDGLGMLVEQAAESFALWHGVKPATAPVIAALRSG